jgi:hypothetical protein
MLNLTTLRAVRYSGPADPPVIGADHEHPSDRAIWAAHTAPEGRPFSAAFMADPTRAREEIRDELLAYVMTTDGGDL